MLHRFTFLEFGMLRMFHLQPILSCHTPWRQMCAWLRFRRGAQEVSLPSPEGLNKWRDT